MAHDPHKEVRVEDDRLVASGEQARAISDLSGEAPDIVGAVNAILAALREFRIIAPNPPPN